MIKQPKDVASPARKSHIPNLPHLSGVRGDSWGSTTACIAAASLIFRFPSDSKSNERALGSLILFFLFVFGSRAPMGVKKPARDGADDCVRRRHEKNNAPVKSVRRRTSVARPTDGASVCECWHAEVCRPHADKPKYDSLSHRFLNLK